MGGQVFQGGGNTCDTLGPSGPAALIPLGATSTTALMDQSRHCPTSTHWRQTNE